MNQTRLPDNRCQSQDEGRSSSSGDGGGELWDVPGFCINGGVPSKIGGWAYGSMYNPLRVSDTDAWSSILSKERATRVVKYAKDCMQQQPSKTHRLVWWDFDDARWIPMSDDDRMAYAIATRLKMGTPWHVIAHEDLPQTEGHQRLLRIYAWLLEEHRSRRRPPWVSGRSPEPGVLKWAHRKFFPHGGWFLLPQQSSIRDGNPTLSTTQFNLNYLHNNNKKPHRQSNPLDSRTWVHTQRVNKLLQYIQKLQIKHSLSSTSLCWQLDTSDRQMARWIINFWPQPDFRLAKYYRRLSSHEFSRRLLEAQAAYRQKDLSSAAVEILHRRGRFPPDSTHHERQQWASRASALRLLRDQRQFEATLELQIQQQIGLSSPQTNQKAPETWRFLEKIRTITDEEEDRYISEWSQTLASALPATLDPVRKKKREQLLALPSRRVDDFFFTVTQQRWERIRAAHDPHLEERRVPVATREHRKLCKTMLMNPARASWCIQVVSRYGYKLQKSYQAQSSEPLPEWVYGLAFCLSLDIRGVPKALCVIGGYACCRPTLSQDWACPYHSRVVINGGFLDPRDPGDHAEAVETALTLFPARPYTRQRSKKRRLDSQDPPHT